MHCFNLTAPYAVLTKLVALRLECVHYRLNWAEKGVVGIALAGQENLCQEIVPSFAHVI